MARVPGPSEHYACHARCFFDWLVEQRVRRDNPARGLRVPVLSRGLPRPISEDDLAAAIAAAIGVIRIWLILAACCGLRAKEISCLSRESVLDTASPPVLIVARNATKGHREHVVPLSGWVAGELRPWLPRAGIVFRRADGKPGPNSPARVSQICNRHLHDCGIAESLHQLRHRFGTAGYAAGRDLRQLQEMMGHADPATTALYVQVCAIGAAGIVEAMLLPVPRLRAVS